MFFLLAHHHGWIQGPATVGQLPVYDEEGKKLLCIVYVCTVSAVCRCVFGNMFMYVWLIRSLSATIVPYTYSAWFETGGEGGDGDGKQAALQETHRKGHRPNRGSRSPG